MEQKQEEEALYWRHALYEVIHGHVERGKVAEHLRAINQRGVLHPSGELRHPSVVTLRRKLRAFLKHSIEGLLRKPRCDKGVSRTLTPAALATLLAAKRALPCRTPRNLRDLIQAEHGIEVPVSTLQRQLLLHGVTRMRLGAVKEPVRKRWTAEAPNAMWVGDYEHGPVVFANGQTVKSRLSAFIDAHSRRIIAARYYATERFDTLIDTLMRGFATFGLPRAMYVDNGKIYWVRSLTLACFRLGIDLLHRPVRDPAAGGVIERFFLTVQTQFESEARLIRDLTIERLNDLFHAWLEESYHRQVHSELKRTPLEAYQAGAVPAAALDLAAVREHFYQVETRTVNKTFSDISIDKVLYRVDHRLRGATVEARIDPFGDWQMVKIYDLKSKAYLGEGRRHQRETGERLPVTEPVTPDSSPVLEALARRHAKRMEQEGFRPTIPKSTWTFATFVACLARLMGLQGDVSAFNEREIALLREVLDRHPDLTRKQVENAVARAEYPALPAILHSLEQEN